MLPEVVVARSPLWHDARVSFALAVAFGAIVAAAAYAGSWALLTVVVLTQMLLVAGWDCRRGVNVRRHFGAEALALAAGIAVAVLVVVRDRDEPLMSAVGVLGLSVVALFVHQLLRRERTNVMASLTSTATLIVVATLPALYLPAVDIARVPGAVPMVAASAAAARSADLVAKAARFWWPTGLAAGAAAGSAGAALTSLTEVEGLVIGLAAGAASHIATLFWQNASCRSPRRQTAMFAAALPISMAAPIAYAAGRVLGG